MKELVRSELIKLVKTKSLREIGEMYGVTYERIRRICVDWGIARRGWKRISLIDDRQKNEKE